MNSGDAGPELRSPGAAPYACGFHVLADLNPEQPTARRHAECEPGVYVTALTPMLDPADVVEEGQRLVTPCGKPVVYILPLNFGGGGERNTQAGPTVVTEPRGDRKGVGEGYVRVPDPDAIEAAEDLQDRGQSPEGHEPDAEPAGGVEVVILACQRRHGQRHHIGQSYGTLAVCYQKFRVTYENPDLVRSEVVGVLHDLGQPLQRVGRQDPAVIPLPA